MHKSLMIRVVRHGCYGGNGFLSSRNCFGAHNLRFQIKDRSKSVEITDTATSVQEKHGRAQVSTCVSVISIMGVEMKWISFCQERLCSRRVYVR